MNPEPGTHETLPPVAPATPPTTGPARRSPKAAAWLSLLPGLGHVYVGCYQRGFAIFAAAIVAFWLAERTDSGPLFPFFIIGFAMIDAYRYAQLINAGSGDLSLPAPVLGKSTRRGRLGFGVFLAVVGLVLLYDRYYPIDLEFLLDWWPLGLVLLGLYLIFGYFRDKMRASADESQLTSA
jgi:hypothetical protein